MYPFRLSRRANIVDTVLDRNVAADLSLQKQGGAMKHLRVWNPVTACIPTELLVENPRGRFGH